jgi:hypothetical protein
MRDIKFRAWDSLGKRMITDGVVSDGGVWGDGWKYLKLGMGGRVIVYASDDGGKNGLWEHEVTCEANQYVLMQFTGLKDRNGVEIYEGDILDTDPLGTVVWSGLAGAWMVDYYPADKGGNIDFLYEVIDGVTLAGNIYENPELLEAT